VGYGVTDMTCIHPGCDRVPEKFGRRYCKTHNSHAHSRQRLAEAVSHGIQPRTYRSRISRGWTHEQALQPLVRPPVPLPITATLKRAGVARRTYYARLERGWDEAKALTAKDFRGPESLRWQRTASTDEISKLLREWR